MLNVSVNEEVKETFECDICAGHYSTKANLKRQLKKHEDPAFECKNAHNISLAPRNLPHTRRPNTHRRMCSVLHVEKRLRRRLISMIIREVSMNRTTT